MSSKFIYCRTTPILKTLRQFENLVFVIMSIREMYALSVELIDKHDLPYFSTFDKNDVLFECISLTLCTLGNLYVFLSSADVLN